MPRFTVSLTEEQNTWVEEQAAALDRSKTYVVRELIDAHRGSESTFTAAVNHGDTGSVRSGDLSERVRALADRVETLEAAVTGNTEHTASGPVTQSTASPVADGGATPDPAGMDDAPGAATAQTPLADTRSGASESSMDAGKQPDEREQTVVGGATGPDGVTQHGPRSASDSVAAATLAESHGSERADESVDIETVRESLREQGIDEELEGALLLCWERLRQRGTAHPDMFKAVFDEQPAGFETPDAWWEAVGGALGGLPGVEAPEGGARFFRYRYQHG